MKTKICNKCNIEKSLSEFSKNKSKKDGYQNRCKFCCSIIKKNYRINNREKINQAQQKYRLENRERINKIGIRSYYKRTEGKVKRNNSRINETKEEFKKRKQLYYQENKEAFKKRNNIFAAKATKELEDYYIKRLIIQNTSLTYAAAIIPQELIKLKRVQLQIKRHIKNMS